MRVIAVESLGDEEDGARADKTRDHLPPGEVVDEAAFVGDVVQEVGCLLGLVDADVFCLGYAFLVFQEEVYEGDVVHLEEWEAKEGAVDEGAEMVVFDGEHVSLCLSVWNGHLHIGRTDLAFEGDGFLKGVP